MNKKPLVVAILDGFGISNYENGNAPLLAKMDNIQLIHQHYPWTLLDASSEAAGLIANTYGTCQNNHSIIGSGRIITGYLKTISDSINDNSFFSNEVLIQTINEAKKRDKKSVHIIGLISKSPIAGFEDDVFALIKLIRQNDLTPIVHAITDGKDVNKKSAITYLNDLNNVLKAYDAKIADISGRYYALDNKFHWNRTIKAWNVMSDHDGDSFSDFDSYIKNQYASSSTDEFFIPQYNSSFNDTKILDDDVVIVSAYRYAASLIALMQNKYTEEDNKYVHRNNLYITTLTTYDLQDINVAFRLKQEINTLSEIIANNNLRQLRISDNLRFNDLTYQFDGKRNLTLNNTNNIKIDLTNSKNITYDLTPQLSSLEITNYIIEHLNEYDVIFVNYANPDVISHTGNLDATIKALKIVDLCIGSLYDEVINKNKGCLIITSDHGNCEAMVDENDNTITYHTMNKVPFILCERKLHLRETEASIQDIAPTILSYLNLPFPKEMTGTSLFKQKYWLSDFIDKFKKKDILLNLKTVNEEEIKNILTTTPRNLSNPEFGSKYIDENDFSTLE
ncbi:MAG: phosphoglycerate mutase (2,3-diphosphoglycerate-independent) [Mycoplasmataceae bacterium]|nr:phosphoglycerate mutase (2,3-diphosphoglycerate-independent) [Mycoplasmataceae bacterium]